MALNLHPNQDGILECRGEYPVYIPETSMLGLRLVEKAHRETLHGGVGLTMARVRIRYWIPKLRHLVKKVRKRSHGCKRFQTLAYAAPTPVNLPTTRTQGTNPYQVIGVDYAGPIRYRVSKQREGKAYVLLYACSLTRGIYLDLNESIQTTAAPSLAQQTVLELSWETNDCRHTSRRMPRHIRDFFAPCGAKFESQLGKCTEKYKRNRPKLGRTARKFLLCGITIQFII